MHQGLSWDLVSVLRHLQHSWFLKGTRSGTVLRESGRRLQPGWAAGGLVWESQDVHEDRADTPDSNSTQELVLLGAAVMPPPTLRADAGDAQRYCQPRTLRAGPSAIAPLGGGCSGRRAAGGADPRRRFSQLTHRGGALLCPEGKGTTTGKAKGPKSPRDRLLAWEMFCFGGSGTLWTISE